MTIVGALAALALAIMAPAASAGMVTKINVRAARTAMSTHYTKQQRLDRHPERLDRLDRHQSPAR